MQWPLWARRKPAGEPEPVPAPLAAPDLIRRGEAAQRLLADPVLAAAFVEIREDSYRLWLDSKPSETERREELYRVVQALELVRGKLRAYRGAGLVRAAERVEEERAA